MSDYDSLTLQEFADLVRREHPELVPERRPIALLHEFVGGFQYGPAKDVVRMQEIIEVIKGFGPLDAHFKRYRYNYPNFGRTSFDRVLSIIKEYDLLS